MKQIVSEIVRIGGANARIKSVTSQRVKYLNDAGQECFVDLNECAGNWVKLHNPVDVELIRMTSQGFLDSYDSSFVGQHGLLDDPPWVEFMNGRHTRLEFGCREEAQALRRKLRGCGLRTKNGNELESPDVS